MGKTLQRHKRALEDKRLTRGEIENGEKKGLSRWDFLGKKKRRDDLIEKTFDQR